MPNTRTDLIIWHLTDSALPTGGFAHSAGLETFVSSGEVSDQASFAAWLRSYLIQASFNEALTVRLAGEIQPGDAQALRRLDGLVHACQTPLQVRTSMNSMGKRMAKVATFIAPECDLVTEYYRGINNRDLHGNPALAMGLVMAYNQVDPERAVAAYLMQMAHSMTQNAIRAIPLGQDAGQKVLVGSYEVIEESTAMTMTHTVADLGVVLPRLEIGQMKHEMLHSRMFMS